jgi:hypothetical protein
MPVSDRLYDTLELAFCGVAFFTRQNTFSFFGVSNLEAMKLIQAFERKS